MSVFWSMAVSVIIGALLLEAPGAVIGGVIGFLLHKVFTLNNRVDTLQIALMDLQKWLVDESVNSKSVSSEEIAPVVSAKAEIAPLTSTASGLVSPIKEEPDLILDEAVAIVCPPEPPSNKTDPWVEDKPDLATENVASNNSIFKNISVLIAKTSLVTRVGAVVLFFGVAFLLKYAAENVSVPIELRLFSVAVGGAALFFVGWKTRHTRAEYSVLLQGGAIGIWYLVTYAAMSLYDVLPVSMGFVLMLSISAFAVFLAVRQDAMSLAVFAVIGGFLAPVLASTGSGSHVMLFGYYAVLNVGIVSITWFKSWRPLILIGFVFTFVIGVAWGVTSYKPENFYSTEPFLLLFMLFYISTILLISLRKQWDHSAVLDGPLVFGTPVIGFILQAQLVQNFDYGMAWSSLGFGVCYLAIVARWWKSLTINSPLLKESFLGIGIVFVSLAIPYAFDYGQTALLWALEGAGGLWLAVRQQRLWGCVLALLAQVGAGVSWLLEMPSSGEYLFYNTGYGNAALISLLGLYSAWLLGAQVKTFKPQRWHALVLGWGLMWWYGAAAWQLKQHLDHSYLPAAALLFMSVSALVLQWLRKKENWQALTPVILAFLPMVVLVGLSSHHFIEKPSLSLGALAWPVAILSLYWLYNKASIFQKGISQLEISWHVATFLLAVSMVSWEVLGRVKDVTLLDSWGLMGAGVSTLFAAWLVIKVRFWRGELDFVYRHCLLALLYVGLLLNILMCNGVDPNISPLSYWPLLNPLDIWQLSVMASAALWWSSKPTRMTAYLSVNSGWSILAVILFIYINTLLMRVMHVSAEIPFNINALLKSDLVQTGLSILWALMGVVFFVASKRWGKRNFWLVGVGLVGVVVLKLFVIDLANSGTVERIVSFMGVGLLLLAVGYVVPIPEKDTADNT